MGTLCKCTKITHIGHVGHAVDAVDAVDSVCSGCSMQWTQYTVDAVCSGIWWWGHCFWCKKVKPVDAVHSGHSGCSGIVVYGGGDIVFGAKGSNQWMQYAIDAVCSAQCNNGIWWWGHCSFLQKGQTSGCSGCSMQWTQWNSDIWLWGHCLWCKKVKPVDSVTN